MSTRLITPPASEPVTLDEAKAHLRLEHALDDAYVTRLITAARQWAERACWRGFLAQTWELTTDAFPESGELELPRGHLSSITSVTYLDQLGASQVLTPAGYEKDDVEVPGVLRLAYGYTWPSTLETWNAVTVRYVVGWATAGDVPEPVKQAQLLLISQMYELRTPEVMGTIVAPVRFAVDALLAPYRLARW